MSRIDDIKDRLAKATPTEEWAKDRTALMFEPSGLYTIVGEAEKQYRDASVWYDDGDRCAEVEDHLAFGISGNAMAELFANAPSDLKYLLTEIERLSSL